MALLWLYYGFLVALLWELQKFPVNFIFGRLVMALLWLGMAVMALLWLWYGFVMEAPGISTHFRFGRLVMALLWLCHGCYGYVMAHYKIMAKLSQQLLSQGKQQKRRTKSNANNARSLKAAITIPLQPEVLIFGSADC
jgi:hypothetical protein